jgi:phospholipid/cholesterol/gamma-HCH transport system ATP-binding protein
MNEKSENTRIKEDGGDNRQEYDIIMENVKKSFGSNEVLKDINLKLPKGENLVILGKSGSGKSVLTKCIVRLVEPDGGKIIVQNTNMLELESTELDEGRTNVGYLFQGGALYDSMTVRENLAFPVRRRMAGKNPKEVEDLVQEALGYVGLKEAIDKMPAELSGGMKKRIGLARTLILKPSIILYDEPTTGLDPVTSGEISDLILKIQEVYGASAIIVTHDMKCARLVSNRVFILREGKLDVSGTYEELENADDEEVRAYFH